MELRRCTDLRVQKLTGGTDGHPPLNNATVIDDDVRDKLFGGPAEDWVFAEFTTLLAKS